MTRDILFLLKHDFPDGDGAPYYCPECAQLNGVLHYYPKLRHWVEVRYVDFSRPRREIIELVGEADQSCPQLVLAGPPPANITGIVINSHNGRRSITGAKAIGEYWSQRYGLGRPH